MCGISSVKQSLHFQWQQSVLQGAQNMRVFYKTVHLVLTNLGDIVGDTEFVAYLVHGGHQVKVSRCFSMAQHVSEWAQHVLALCVPSSGGGEHQGVPGQPGPGIHSPCGTEDRIVACCCREGHCYVQ
jgi:hypothetical protein